MGKDRTEKEAILAALKEIILPELQLIKQEQVELKMGLALTNKRLDVVNAHLIDQSRRIDENNARLDRLYEVIVRREEHQDLAFRVTHLEKELAEIQKRLAA